MNDITDKDKALWEAAMKDVIKTDTPPAEEDFAALLDAPPKTKDETTNKPTSDLSPKQSETPVIQYQNKPHNEPLDRALERKLKQGKITPDGKIDLHGMNQQQAHAALNNYIENAYNRQKKYILVITGKGKSQASAEDWITPSQGVLKQKLPHWIKQAPLKRFIIDAVPAHIKHGGGGAFYLILKKKK